MIDLHAHVLPGIDDGPRDLAGSLALLRVAAKDGTRVIAATPHLRADYPDVRVEAVRAVCEALERRIGHEHDLRIIGAGEVDLLWALAADHEQLRLASFGGRGTDLLVETPYRLPPETFRDGLASLMARGFRVLLAHPELNRGFQRRPDHVESLVADGVLLQVTASSLTSSPRRSRHAAFARLLVEEELAHVIASDAHSAGTWRPPGLSHAVAVAQRLAPSRAGWMVTAAPAAILAGKPLPPVGHASRSSRSLRSAR